MTGLSLFPRNIPKKLEIVVPVPEIVFHCRRDALLEPCGKPCLFPRLQGFLGTVIQFVHAHYAGVTHPVIVKHDGMHHFVYKGIVQFRQLALILRKHVLVPFNVRVRNSGSIHAGYISKDDLVIFLGIDCRHRSLNVRLSLFVGGIAVRVPMIEIDIQTHYRPQSA